MNRSEGPENTASARIPSVPVPSLVAASASSVGVAFCSLVALPRKSIHHKLSLIFSLKRDYFEF